MPASFVALLLRKEDYYVPADILLHCRSIDFLRRLS